MAVEGEPDDQAMRELLVAKLIAIRRLRRSKQRSVPDLHRHLEEAWIASKDVPRDSRGDRKDFLSLGTIRNLVNDPYREVFPNTWETLEFALNLVIPSGTHDQEAFKRLVTEELGHIKSRVPTPSSPEFDTLDDCKHPHSSLFEVTKRYLEQGRIVECCIPPGYELGGFQNDIIEQFERKAFLVNVFNFHWYAEDNDPVLSFGRELMTFFSIETNDTDDNEHLDDSYWPFTEILNAFRRGKADKRRRLIVVAGFDNFLKRSQADVGAAEKTISFSVGKLLAALGLLLKGNQTSILFVGLVTIRVFDAVEKTGSHVGPETMRSELCDDEGWEKWLKHVNSDIDSKMGAEFERVISCTGVRHPEFTRNGLIRVKKRERLSSIQHDFAEKAKCHGKMIREVLPVEYECIFKAMETRDGMKCLQRTSVAKESRVLAMAELLCQSNILCKSGDDFLLRVPGWCWAWEDEN